MCEFSLFFGLEGGFIQAFWYSHGTCAIITCSSSIFTASLPCTASFRLPASCNFYMLSAADYIMRSLCCCVIQRCDLVVLACLRLLLASAAATWTAGTGLALTATGGEGRRAAASYRPPFLVVVDPREARSTRASVFLVAGQAGAAAPCAAVAPAPARTHHLHRQRGAGDCSSAACRPPASDGARLGWPGRMKE